MSRPTPQRLSVDLSGVVNVCGRDAAEGNQVDIVNFDFARSDEVTPTHLHLRSTPQPKRHRDPPAGDVVAQLRAKLHGRILRFEAQPRHSYLATEL
jgi:hypothetical protein